MAFSGLRNHRKVVSGRLEEGVGEEGVGGGILVRDSERRKGGKRNRMKHGREQRERKLALVVNKFLFSDLLMFTKHAHNPHFYNIMFQRPKRSHHIVKAEQQKTYAK